MKLLISSKVANQFYDILEFVGDFNLQIFPNYLLVRIMQCPVEIALFIAFLLGLITIHSVPQSNLVYD